MKTARRILVPRINVEEEFWVDPRLSALTIKLGDEYRAIGAVVKVWRIAQGFFKTNKIGIPLSTYRKQNLPPELIDVGFAEIREDFVYVSGSAKYFDWLQEAKTNGSKGGKKRARNHSEKKQANPSQSRRTQPSSSSFTYSSEKYTEGVKSDDLTNPRPDATLGSRIFDSYKKAYEERYGIEPVRNSTVNAQCSQLGKRLGEEGVPIAAFFLKHEGRYFKQTRHSLGSLLSAAESVAVDYKLGITTEDGVARDTRNPVDIAMEELRAEGKL